MKLSNILKTIRVRGMAALAASAMLATNAIGGSFFDSNVGGVDLAAARGGGPNYWMVFALSGGVSITDAGPLPLVNDPGYPANGLTPDWWDVFGNVGVGGVGNLTMSASRIRGSIYIRTGGTQTLSSGAFINNPGGVIPPIPGAPSPSGLATNALLIATASNAKTASDNASLLATNWVGAAPITVAQNNSPLSLAIAAVANTTYVLNLKDLILSGVTSVLTLSGNNQANVNYVINVERFMSLSGGAKIKLENGLLPQNVLFNVEQSPASGFTYDVTLGGGSKVDGIILAPNRTVKLTGASIVKGEVIGKAVSLSGYSRVYNPEISP